MSKIEIIVKCMVEIKLWCLLSHNFREGQIWSFTHLFMYPLIGKFVNIDDVSQTALILCPF